MHIFAKEWVEYPFNSIALASTAIQGGHILAKMKFPVFSLSFCVTKIFPVLFLHKN